MKRIITFFASLALLVPVQARELVTFPVAANNYQEYPENNLPDVSQAPKGYENFHIEHYGRHGSRWLIGTYRHDGAINYLQRGDTLAGGLTPRGKEVLAEVKEYLADLQGREGDLSPKGAQQHRDIGRRMAKNFPGIFRKGAYVNAHSTMVQRCIISMSNSLLGLLSVQPQMNVELNASESETFYMKNVTDKPAIKAEKDAMTLYFEDYRQKNGTDGKFLAKLFNDPEAAARVMDEDELAGWLYDIAANSVSTGEQSDIANLFSPEETDRLWRLQNAKWFLRSGKTPMTGGLVPLRQRFLLRNMIESADTAMTSTNASANLRYGHEVIVIPLVTLMELNDYGKEYASLDNIEENWRSYEIFPMACNVQMVFARPVKKKNYTADDVIVKVLLNERPVKLPVPFVNGDYVSWPALRNYYLEKIGNN